MIRPKTRIALLGSLLLLGCPGPPPPAPPANSPSPNPTQTGSGSARDTDMHDLADSNPEIRVEALKSLATRLGNGTAPPGTWPALEQVLLGDSSADVRGRAISAVGTLPLDALGEEQILALLTAAGGDATEGNRNTATFVLGDRGEKTAPIVTKILQDTEQPETLRIAAADALAASGAAGVKPLGVALRYPSVAIRTRAALGLSELGEVAEPLIPLLVQLLGDPVQEVRTEAKLSLSLFDPQATLPHLLRALKDEQPLVRHGALDVLITAEDVETVIPAVERLLEDPDEDVRKKAAHTLKELRGEGEKPASGEGPGDD